jgi:2-methylcitrate dehydratase PrpD
MSLPAQTSPSRLHRLASWATSLRYEDIPPDVVARTKDFFLDTLACTIAGRSHPAIIAVTALAKKMGPSSGPCEITPFPEIKTSPAFAALINGAARTLSSKVICIIAV